MRVPRFFLKWVTPASFLGIYTPATAFVDFQGEGFLWWSLYIITGAVTTVGWTMSSDGIQLWKSRGERKAIEEQERLGNIHAAIDSVLAEKENWPEGHPNLALLDGQLEALRGLIQHRELSKDEGRLSGVLELTNKAINREIK